jgi:hypothetical protein
LHREFRNRTLWRIVTGFDIVANRWGMPLANQFRPTTAVVLLPGTELKFDRIFIRQGHENYNSVTFRGEVHHNGVIRKVRFWATLDDANKIDYEVIAL